MNLIEKLGLEKCRTIVSEASLLDNCWDTVDQCHRRCHILAEGDVLLSDLRTAIQQQLQIELNNCSVKDSSKNSIEDNCTDIRNHISPLTGVIER